MIEFKRVMNRSEPHYSWRADRWCALPFHRRMDERHYRALSTVATAYQARTGRLGEGENPDRAIGLDDGDLVWRNGSDCLIFTVVEVPAGEFVRAVRLTSDEWRTVADWPVTPTDPIGTARTIWQLILLIQAEVEDSGIF
ncbi:hypothetical protein M2284_000058 [Rhodococcus sp. LBL1]|nr:hypothetical protein [Rhodococcus sp. LBL1]MDH6681156.1 hypothetical protein [Rhodococcus sp. LBL2]